MKLLLFALFFLLACQSANAQFYPVKYRPPNLDWQQLATPHFRIVFPKGEDSVALRTGRILEHEYGEIQGLVGGGLHQFPVILNNYNDFSNGFVSPLNFRSEIEIPAIKGKAMNPQSGDWLETVAPHELVHALNFSHLDGIWATVINVFSPDLARSIHSAIPLGVLEGIATYHETKNVVSGGGRGNYPYFYNQFNSVFHSSGRWSMGQMMGYSGYSRPFNRHYLGGYEFTAWLQATYGRETTNKAIDFYIRWPFLGYGVALKHATGFWPGQLYNRFEEKTTKDLEQVNSNAYDPLDVPFKGKEMRRPLWLSENRLLMYGSFYNARPGFYAHDLKDGSFERLIETRTVQDFVYDLSADRSRLLFSNYRPNARYNNAFKTELYEADLLTRKVTRLTTGMRVYAPVYSGNDILALQTYHASNSLIQVNFSDTARSSTHLATLPRSRFVSIRPNPVNPGQLAVVANQGGLQGLWIAGKSTLEKELQQPPEISFTGGSVFDPAWHPSGERLLFSSGHSGTMQIYEYDLLNDSVRQVTNAPFNAMEASYSPGGDRVVFIVQQKNERLPVVLNRDGFLNEPVPPSAWKPAAKKESMSSRPKIGADLKPESENWPVSSYRSRLDWLLPRTIVPDIDEVSGTGTYQIGIGFYGADLLQRNSYTVSTSVVQNLPWYNLKYRHTGFFPGFLFKAFNDPGFPVLRLTFPNESFQDRRMLRQDLGFSLSLPFRYVLENNSRFSSLLFSPELKLRGTRFFELDHNGDPASGFATFFTGNLSAVFNYKLQQNIRDVQPNTGLVFYSELEHFFNTDSTSISTLNNRFSFKFSQPSALRAGLFFYTSPLRRWNQSLRIGIEGLTQTAGVFFNQDLVSNGFSEAVFPRALNMLSLSARYTIPLVYPDDGGFLLPFYLSNVYLAGFINTVSDLGRTGSLADFYTDSRTVFGLGIRTQFRISNLAFDIGIAYAIEPMRANTHWFIGNF